MRRRSFLVAAAGASLLGPARAASGVIERRTYRGCTPEFRFVLEQCLRQAGIDAELQPSTDPSYLCRFANLAERNAAWNRVSTLPEWREAAKGFRGYRFELDS